MRSIRLTTLAGFFGLAFALLPVPGRAQDAAEGGALYQWYCATCHGIDGTGAGPMSPVLLVQPTDLTGLGAAEGGVFPLLRVVRRIDGSDPLVSHGSAMPVYGPMFRGDEVALKTASGQPVLMGRAVADLVLYLQEIQK
ncbi:c-type cytochrome [Seohaeicola saemankumensis]|uniref:C-type cytochrome n=1 Tax=Seohaeicola saemankumensis TaxID=481181 RepID=A0ABW3T8C2_9RHOB|nr:cytochrome c [Paracoccaceae bacterium]